MGLFSFVGGLLGGGSKKKAARKAADAQIEFAQKGLDEAARQFDVSRADQMPWLQAGQEALSGQGDLLGLNGGSVQQGAIDALRESPLYQSLFANGQNAILANGSATGGLRGGDMQRSLADFGRDSLSQVIQQQLANFGGLSGQGAATGAGLGALGADNAKTMAALFGQQGAAKAGMYTTIGGVNAQNWGNAGSFLDSIASSIAGGNSLGSTLRGLF